LAMNVFALVIFAGNASGPIIAGWTGMLHGIQWCYGVCGNRRFHQKATDRRYSPSGPCCPASSTLLSCGKLVATYCCLVVRSG
jgi:hypothetical protein